MHHYFPFLLILISLASCTRKAEFDEPALAKVGSSVLTFSEAKANIPTYLFNQDSISAYEKYREEWIQNQILLQEAYRLRVHREPKVLDRLANIREDYIAKAAQEYIIAELGNELTVTDEEARSYYQENRDSFVLEERYVRFRHIRAATLEDAQDAREDLMRGIEWEIIANNFTINPDLAIRESERFWPESVALNDYQILNRYLQLIGLSEISAIEQIGDEYHFVQLLEERVAGDHPDLEWLIDQIKDWLILEKKRIAFNTYVKNLYLQAQANNEIETYAVQQ
ncbi:MAG: hypothetical protein JJ895_05665 [Balneolaceae bacterium]|nr:hypothetical protein [Balneolaceae bacterium]